MPAYTSSVESVGYSRFEHGRRVIQKPSAHGVVQLERGRIAQDRFLILAQDVLRQHAQVLILEALRALIQLIEHRFGRKGCAGHKLRHVHRFVCLHIADAVDLELLLIFPKVDRRAHLNDGVRFVSAVLLGRIVPKLGGAFAARIRKDEIQIAAALDVALLCNAFDDAVPFHLIGCGVMNF